MKIALFALCLMGSLVTHAQSNPKDYFSFKDSKKLIFADDFDSMKDGWELYADNEDETGNECVINKDSVGYTNGIFHIYNHCREDIVMERVIDMDWKGNYEIIVVAKAYVDEGNDSTLGQGLIKWNEEVINTKFSAFFFSGYFNEFHTHSGYDSLKGRCIGLRKHIKFARNTYQEFVRYTIRKYNDKYYIFVNGLLRGTYPCVNFNGNSLSIGARRYARIEFDHISVYSLP